MLDQLVESRNTSGENKRRSGFLMTTFVVVMAIALGGLLWSLFAKNLNMGDENLELSTLVAPVPVPEEAPPPPEPEQPEPEKQQVKQQPDTNVSMRKENILRLDESPTVPPKISTQQTTAKARPKGTFVIGDRDVTVSSAPSSAPRSSSGGGGSSIVASAKPERVEPPARKEAVPPPPPPPPPAPPPKVPKKISKGVVNGSAISLPKPPYPAAARAVRASGAVNVQVEISEGGSVVSASAVSGHPLLRRAAEQAARRAKFKPTLLSGQAVSVSGTIVYNFVP